MTMQAITAYLGAVDGVQEDIRAILAIEKVWQKLKPEPKSKKK